MLSDLLRVTQVEDNEAEIQIQASSLWQLKMNLLQNFTFFYAHSNQ
jgi:hypothetical protein